MKAGVLASVTVLPLFLALHTDNLVVKVAVLAIYSVVVGVAAFRLRLRFRVLLLVDVLITVAVTLLLMPSAETFIHYRWGWIAHAVATFALLFTAADGLRFPLSPRMIYWLLIGFSALSLTAALLLLPTHYSLVDFVLVIWTLGALPLTCAAMMRQRLTFTTSVWRRPLLAALAICGVLVSVGSMRAFPNWTMTDEATIFDYADTYVRTGVIEVSMTPDHEPTVTGNLYVYAATFWLRLFPDNPYAVRAFSMVGGLLLIVIVFALTRLLTDGLTAWIGVALLVTNLLWIGVSHVGRQEIWLTVVVYAAVGLSVLAQRRRAWQLALLAGILVALSADTHPLGAYACIALGGWWLVSWRRERTLLLAFVIGGLIGAAYYMATHILPDPAAFVQALRDEAVSYGAEGWTPLAAMIARHAAYAVANPLELGLLIGGAVAGLRYQRGLGVFVATLMLLYALTVADPNPYYPMVWITGMVILTAVALRNARASWRAPLLVVVWGVFVLNGVLIGRMVAANWNDKALTAVEQVAAVIPTITSPDEQGMGEAFLYLPLRDPRYIGFPYVEFAAADAGVSRWEMVEQIAPDWLVTLRDETSFAPEFAVLSVDVPHMHLQIPDDLLTRHYELARRVVTEVGEFQVWRRRVLSVYIPQTIR